MTDCCASLGLIIFEELTIISSAWGNNLYDLVALNEAQVEEIEDIAHLHLEYEQMLVDDVNASDWDSKESASMIDW